MRGRYFRYLFENSDRGLFHTGSIYDKERQKVINYVYMAGSYSRNMPWDREGNRYEEVEDDRKVIDILVIGSYSSNYIKKLIFLLKNGDVRTVILPYLAPIQRLVLVEEMKNDGMEGKEATRFLQDPYRFIRKLGVERIYFVYGNGMSIQREPEELERGFHFEAADAATLQQIREMEGYAVPIVRAGYIVENDFLFYFGVYGMDLRLLLDFARDYFSHIENIHVLSENAQEDYAGQTKRLVQEFLRRFGNSPMTTVAMFVGPLYASAGENESFLTEKEFCRGDGCEEWESCKKDDGLSCVISCTYGRDYDNMQHHKRSGEKTRFGMLLLGNLNVNRYFFELISRFLKVLPQVRCISVPNCGNGENWNHQLLTLFQGKDRIYWICAKHAVTSAGVVSDIVLSDSNQRLLPVDEEWGCCLSGYIIPKEDMD